MSGSGSGVGIVDNHSATLFTRSVAVDDRVFLAITKSAELVLRWSFLRKKVFAVSGKIYFV